MPSAVVVTTTEKFDLKTLPGGYVELKRMSYGEAVQRRAMMKLSFATDSKSKDFQGEMAMASVDIQVYEFSKCVVDHNLTDGDADNAPKLNLGLKSTLDKLDPRIGGEIESLITKMNDFDADEEDEVKN